MRAANRLSGLPQPIQSLPSFNDFASESLGHHTSGAQVFSSRSIQFAWGLDSDNVFPARADSRVKQFVINILGNMGAKPLTPDEGMVVP
jgi:hypothetical protein